ncbi:hypothetical protein [Paraburkholderia sp.]|uniref:hypothetical protein n=1 Tax=Paraburkholderia sp. TaxID=1926495 RepID=UPI0039E5A1B9
MDALPNRVSETSARRIAVVAGFVLAARVGLLAPELSMQDKLVEKPLESQTITAELISAAPAPVSMSAALQSSAPRSRFRPSLTRSSVPSSTT